MPNLKVSGYYTHKDITETGANINTLNGTSDLLTNAFLILS
jgi:hypothetical protein